MHTAPPSAQSFPVALPRSGFGPRLSARPGDVWRAMQDVVTDQSSSVGWTPERYVEAGLMFVVRDMVVLHHREVRLGEALSGRTWPSRARRDTLFTREVRLFSQDELVATGTQEWALVSRTLEPTRAGAAMYQAFTLEAGFPSAKLPPFSELPGGAVHHFDFRTWHLEMDPHGHANHPAYLDFCDEGLCRALARVKVDPQALCPVAEEVHFRAAIGPDEAVRVESYVKGRNGDVGVFGHRVLVGDRVCATATTSRRVLGAPTDWMELLR